MNVLVGALDGAEEDLLLLVSTAAKADEARTMVSSRMSAGRGERAMRLL